MTDMDIRRKRHLKDNRGTVLLESLMTLPLLLVCIMGVAQFAHIWITKHMVFYSAFCAARATLTCNSMTAPEEARKAAEVVLVNLTASKDKPDFTVTLNTSRNKWEKVATISYKMPLMVPIAGEIIAAGGNQKVNGFPAITLTEKCLLPCPYDTSNYPK